MIEKNIPIPPRKGGGRPAPAHAEDLKKMQKGDSFLVPIVSDVKSTKSKISNDKRKYAPGISLRFAVEGDKLRVWRRM